MVKVIYNIL